MDSAPARLHLLVSGRVQGVGFRFSARDEALDLGVTGWVRNLPGGEVEILAEGRRDRLEMFEAWAHLGPSMAQVTEVRADWRDFTGEFGAFRIR